MDVLPTEIEKVDGGRSLKIGWSDGQLQTVTAKVLRDACPCATCFEKNLGKAKKMEAGQKKSLPILSPEQLVPLQVAQMKPAGGYAYQITFSDGHGTGLYSLDLIRELGDTVRDSES